MELLMIGGGDSVDYESLTATPGEVMEGKGFLGAGSDEVQTGTAKDRSQRGTSPGIEGDTTKPVHQSTSSRFVTDTNGVNKLIMCPPDGIYPGANAYVGELLDSLGITADKIAYGEEIGLVEGTFSVEGTAGSNDIRAGKVAYVRGQRIDGMLNDKGAVYKELSAGETYTIGAGVYSEGRVVAKNLSSQTSGTAAAGDILNGKSAWVNGAKVNGTMTDRGTVTQELSAGGSYTIPAGKHSGSGKVTAKSLASQTSATASAAQIQRGYTAWANGSKITGTLQPSASSIAKGATVAGVTGTWYGNKAMISAVAYDMRSGGSDTYHEQSFTMPASGTVYYGGCAGGWYYSDGDTNATCAIYRNGSLVDNRNINSGAQLFRGTMFNKSFSANAGDVIKVVASCGRGSRGDFIMSCIQAMIVY